MAFMPVAIPAAGVPYDVLAEHQPLKGRVDDSRWIVSYLQQLSKPLFAKPIKLIVRKRRVGHYICY